MRDAWGRLAALKASAEADDPLALRQAKWLQNCLYGAQNTRFGIKHGFECLRSPKEFQESVPLHTYEDLLPWLEQVAHGVPNVLFEGLPIAFERTGGSEGGAKLIPYFRAGLLDFQKALRPWLGEAVRRYGLSDGSCYWVTSPALREPEEIHPGIPIGLPDIAYLGEDLLPDLGRLSALPTWVATLRDEVCWRLATMHSLVVRSDLVFISLWSPTFFLILLDHLTSECPQLDELLQIGGQLEGHQVHPDHAGLKRLRAFRARGQTELLWPRLRLVSAWADGASVTFAMELRDRLPQACFEPKGLLSTEGVISVPLAGGDPVLAGDSTFFEFLDGKGEARFAHELEEGHAYEVVLTTASGLYRYRTGDSIRCTGFAGDAPRIQFLGRLGLVSDLVGEKLNEAFVAQCLEGLQGFRMLIPSTKPELRYLLVMDKAHTKPDLASIRSIETRLEGNPQYAHARRLGQLGALEHLPVQDPLVKYMARSTLDGHRAGDLKVPALCPGLQWERIFRQEHP